MLIAEVDWLLAVKEVGFPIVAAGTLAAAVWAVVKWSANQIFIPLRDAFTGFLGSVKNNLETQTTALQDISSNSATMTKSLADHTHKLDAIAKTNAAVRIDVDAIVKSGCANYRNARLCRDDE